jgi:hypothetical protein
MMRFIVFAIRNSEGKFYQINGRFSDGDNIKSFPTWDSANALAIEFQNCDIVKISRNIVEVSKPTKVMSVRA